MQSFLHDRAVVFFLLRIHRSSNKLTTYRPLMCTKQERKRTSMSILKSSLQRPILCHHILKRVHPQCVPGMDTYESALVLASFSSPVSQQTTRIRGLSLLSGSNNSPPVIVTRIHAIKSRTLILGFMDYLSLV